MSEHRYWFRASPNWGWGLPLTWEGWLVSAVFFALIGVATWLCPPGTWAASVAILVALLSGVCWLTGEPPRRWWWTGDRGPR